MACNACGWPGESDAHVPDCWMAYVPAGRWRNEAQAALGRLEDALFAAEVARNHYRAALERVVANPNHFVDETNCHYDDMPCDLCEALDEARQALAEER